MGKSIRNQRLELFRFIAAYGIVFIHIPLPGNLGVAINCLARAGVPLFFMSAGYYSWGRDARTLLRRACHSLKLLGLACILPAILECSVMLSRGEPLSGYLFWLVKPEHVKKLLCVQILPFTYAAPLWFLVALAMVYFIWWAMTVLSGTSPLPYSLLALVAGVALIAHLSFGEGRMLLGLQPVDALILRNLWLDGLPFFALGVWLGSVERNLIHAVRAVPVYGVLAAGAVLALLSRGRTGYLDLHFGSVLMALAAMIAAICWPELKAPAAVLNLLSESRAFTMLIYVLHVPVYGLIKEGGRSLNVLRVMWEDPVVLPLVVVVGTTALSALLVWLRGKVGPANRSTQRQKQV